NLMCMAFTVSAMAAVLLSSALVVGVPVVLAVFGLQDEWAYLAPLRWPLLFFGYVGALALIYRLGPSRARARWRWLTPGALFADPADAWGQLSFLYEVLPSNVAQFLGAEMTRLAGNSTGQLTFTLVWTLLLTLWAANGGVKTLFYGLNLAYHEVERRNIVVYNLMCMAFTVSAMAAVLLSSALVVGVPVVLAVFGLQDEWTYLAPLRWPLLFFGYVGALALIYRLGPSRARARWRWLTPGALFAAIMSLLVSFLFSWFLTNFVRTDSYGPLAAAMGFLLWTWFSVQVILMGARLNAEIEHQTAQDTTTGAPLPIGERGAVMADSVGARRGNPAALAYTLKYAESLGDRVLRRNARKTRL
ncbi:MAG TPA: YhjD/YihY/BrkB family envelope integrity protein, partial [Brevundimonas sp.]